MKQYQIEKPLADASSFRYRLKKVVGGAKVSDDLRFELRVVVGGCRLVVFNGKNCLYFRSVRISTRALSCDSLSKGQKGIFQYKKDGMRPVGIK